VHIIVVEDNISVAKGIAYVLRDEGHAVDLLHDGNDATEFLRRTPADLIILDINLPGRDGLAILRDLRADGDTTPVILLTARSETCDKIRGLDSGADDYLVKPFEMDELLARARALARRTPERTTAHKLIGSLSYDVSTRSLTGPYGQIDVPRRELSVFEALLMAQGRNVTKQTLLDKVYGTGSDVDEKVVEVYISRLRGRLLEHDVEIKVQRGLGYLMQAKQ